MNRPSRLSYLLTSILVPVILFSILPIAVLAATYFPEVLPGDLVDYGQVSAHWYSSSPGISEPQFIAEVDHVSEVNMTVDSVSGSMVTAVQFWSFTNGTSPRSSSVSTDVATGISTPNSFLVWFIAGGLTQGDRLYNIPFAPTINKTITATYAGEVRTVNVFNVTITIATVKQTLTFFWDQPTGILLERMYTLSCSQPYISATGSSDIKATKMGHQSSNGDFHITASPLTLTFQTDGTGASTVTLTSLNGFNGRVTLSELSQPSGLTCTLNSASVILGASAAVTLSCRGSPGTYTVTVTGTGRSGSHQETLQATVTAPPPSKTPEAPTIFGLQPFLFYGIVGVVAAVIVAAIGLALRGRKPTPPPVTPVTPSETPTTPVTP